MFLVSGASYEASYKTSFQSDGFATYQESSIKSFVGIQLPQNYEMLVTLGLLRIKRCPSLCFLDFITLLITVVGALSASNSSALEKKPVLTSGSATLQYTV